MQVVYHFVVNNDQNDDTVPNKCVKSGFHNFEVQTFKNEKPNFTQEQINEILVEIGEKKMAWTCC